MELHSEVHRKGANARVQIQGHNNAPFHNGFFFLGQPWYEEGLIVLSLSAIHFLILPYPETQRE
jgi:hypothetical protein